MAMASPGEYRSSAATSGGNGHGGQQQDTLRLRQQLADKDETIRELRETIDILEIKVQKLEQLVRLKDTKITALTEKLQKK
jgi:predicted RNase H-like nuclease (RuvC/YqgF family)